MPISRAMLLPTPGDPYIMAAWMNLYRRIWRPEITKLYIHLNSRLEDPVMDYMKELCAGPEVDITYTKAWMGHGEALRVIFDKCTEDYISLIEDDGYITHARVVDQAFRVIEQGAFDCVVTPRGSCTESLRIRETQVFGLRGNDFYKPNFWPCFFFSSRQTLEDTDKNFMATNAQLRIPKGEYLPILDWTPPEDCSMDTFGWTSLQLRKRGLRFLVIEDGRATTQDLFLSPQQQGIFAPTPIAPWVHFGSTSSGISTCLLDDKLLPLENRTVNSQPSKLPTIPDDHIADDTERRLSLWRLCHRHFPIPAGHPAEYFNQVYADAMERLIVGCNLNRERLATYEGIYSNLLAEMFRRD